MPPKKRVPAAAAAAAPVESEESDSDAPSSQSEDEAGGAAATLPEEEDVSATKRKAGKSLYKQMQSIAKNSAAAAAAVSRSTGSASQRPATQLASQTASNTARAVAAAAASVPAPAAVARPTFSGKGIGKGGSHRRGRLLRANINGITKPAIRRVARRAGVLRISGGVYDEARSALKSFLSKVISCAVTYTDHARRNTVTTMDIVYALRHIGRPLLGFDNNNVGALHATK